MSQGRARLIIHGLPFHPPPPPRPRPRRSILQIFASVFASTEAALGSLRSRANSPKKSPRWYSKTSSSSSSSRSLRLVFCVGLFRALLFLFLIRRCGVFKKRRARTPEVSAFLLFNHCASVFASAEVWSFKKITPEVSFLLFVNLLLFLLQRRGGVQRKQKQTP